MDKSFELRALEEVRVYVSELGKFLEEITGGHDVAYWQQECERMTRSNDLNEAWIAGIGLRAAELLAGVPGTKGGEKDG